MHHYLRASNVSPTQVSRRLLPGRVVHRRLLLLPVLLPGGAGDSSEGATHPGGLRLQQRSGQEGQKGVEELVSGHSAGPDGHAPNQGAAPRHHPGGEEEHARRQVQASASQDHPQHPGGLGEASRTQSRLASDAAASCQRRGHLHCSTSRGSSHPDQPLVSLATHHPAHPFYS